MNKSISWLLITLVVVILALFLSLSLSSPSMAEYQLDATTNPSDVSDNQLSASEQAQLEKIRLEQLEKAKLEKCRTAFLNTIKKQNSAYKKYLTKKNKRIITAYTSKIKKSKSRENIKKYYYTKIKPIFKHAKVVKKRFHNTGPSNFKSRGVI